MKRKQLARLEDLATALKRQLIPNPCVMPVVSQGVVWKSLAPWNSGASIARDDCCGNADEDVGKQSEVAKLIDASDAAEAAKGERKTNDLESVTVVSATCEDERQGIEKEYRKYRDGESESESFGPAIHGVGLMKRNGGRKATAGGGKN